MDKCNASVAMSKRIVVLYVFGMQETFSMIYPDHEYFMEQYIAHFKPKGYIPVDEYMMMTTMTSISFIRYGKNR